MTTARTDEDRPRRRGDTGFSLTEFLIIVLTVAVLAVIGIAVTTSAQPSAADATARTNVTAAVDAIGRFAFAHDGALPSEREFVDGSVEFPNVPTNEPGYVVYSLNADGTRFCVAAAGDGAHVFVADNKLSATLGTCVDGVATATEPTTTPAPADSVIGSS